MFTVLLLLVAFVATVSASVMSDLKRFGIPIVPTSELPPLRANSNDSSYLMFSSYSGSPTCSSGVPLVGGVRIGSCSSSVEGSSMFVDPIDTPSATILTSCSYTTTDCSGKAICGKTSIPKKCLPNGENGMMYQVVLNSLTPWSALASSGVIVQ
jgi:hypothetical protein